MLLWPDRCMRVASTRFMTPRRLPLIARMTWPRLPLLLSRTRRPPKFITSFQDPCDLVGVGGSSQPHQPMKIRHPAWLTQRPRLGHQPKKIHPAYLPARWPGRGHRPIGILPFQDLTLEPAGHLGVLSWSIPKASSPLLCHNILFQQPIKMEIAQFSWTTLKSGVYINRPRLTPDRIRLSTVNQTLLWIAFSALYDWSHKRGKGSWKAEAWNRVPAAPRRSTRHSAKHRRRPSWSCCITPWWTTYHGGGHPRARTYWRDSPARTIATEVSRFKVLALVFWVNWSIVKGPEFPIVVWNWRSVIDLYGIGFVAPKRPQVFVVLRIFVFVVFRVFLLGCWVYEFLSPVFLTKLYFC